MAEMSMGQGSLALADVSSQTSLLPTSYKVPYSSSFQATSPVSPLPCVIHGIGSPTHLAVEYMNLLPANSPYMPSSGQQAAAMDNAPITEYDISSLHQLCCKIILAGLEFNSKPVTHADICSHILNRLVNLDGSKESDGIKSWRSRKALIEWRDVKYWQDWLVFSDLFFFLIESGYIDFVYFVDKLVSRLTESDPYILRTNHVTWLLAQIIQVEHVRNALNSDTRKVVV